MKKALLGGMLVSLTLLPMAVVLAQIETVPPAPVTSIEGFINILRFFANVIFTVVMVLAVIFILLAAFQYLLAFGNPEKVKAAHSMIIYSMVAVGVALLAQGIRLIVQSVLQRGT